MREILFRGKDKDTGKWLFGYYGMNTCGSWPLRPMIYPVEDAKAGWLHYEEIIPETLGQYTDLDDKNGKPIFEGDILAWDEKEWGGPHKEVATWDYELLASRVNDWKEWCEVIGNIHDNPELMIEVEDNA